MLGSAVQNVIALADSVFLWHLSDFDFQVIGIVSVFYLIISAIGFGFSRGGQILIARKHGERNNEEIKKSFYSLVAFEAFLAIIMFLFIYFLGESTLQFFIDDPKIVERGMEYLIPRSYGIFFSYVGVSMIALYTGISRPIFIIIDTLILAIVNIILNYGLIFGHFGLPQLGIAGAGYASAFAEFIAFLCFVIYMLYDQKKSITKLFSIPKLELQTFKTIFTMSSNIVLQTIVGLGGSFVFFGLIENLGGKALSISNLVRIIYLCLSIPTWGFASGMNTITSRLIGQGNIDEIPNATNRVALLNVIATMILTLPIVLYPEFILYPIMGKSDMSSITDAQPILYMLLGIMFLFSLSSIYFDSIIGLGATKWGFRVKLIVTVFYLLLVKWIVDSEAYGLKASWGAEVLYWGIIALITGYYFYTGKWKHLITH